MNVVITNKNKKVIGRGSLDTPSFIEGRQKNNSLLEPNPYSMEGVGTQHGK